MRQCGGRQRQAATAEPGVIKRSRAMWKRRKRALKALAGDNMSTEHIDHMGGPVYWDAQLHRDTERGFVTL